MNVNKYLGMELHTEERLGRVINSFERIVVCVGKQRGLRHKQL